MKTTTTAELSRCDTEEARRVRHQRHQRQQHQVDGDDPGPYRHEQVGEPVMLPPEVG
jgi:hypothetical protein